MFYKLNRLKYGSPLLGVNAAPSSTSLLFTDKDSVLGRMTLLTQCSVDMDSVGLLSVLWSGAQLQAHRITVCRRAPTVPFC